MSQKSAIMLLDGKTEEQAEAELSRIEAENPAPEEGNPDIFNDITGLTSPISGEEVDADEPEGTVEETVQPTD